MKNLMSYRNLTEFIKYAFVGGFSALVDMAVLYCFTEFVFESQKTGLALTVSVAAGFFVGLAVNYFLSLVFVFTSAEQKSKGRKLSSFLIYAAVGIIGLGLTEGLMHLGMRFVSREGFWYLLLNCFVKGVVLIWNYIGRKIFVYKGK
jgi:putative flippase GtrA